MKLTTPDGFSAILITAFLFTYLRRFLDTETRLPAWEPYLKRVWLIGLGLYAILAVLFVNDVDTGWYWLAVGLLVSYILWLVWTYRPARTILLALAPALITVVVSKFVKQFASTFHDRYDDYFGSAGAFSIIWLVTFVVIASRQKKAFVRETEERELEAQQRRVIETRKEELERLVAERTAEITQQKEELERALAELKTTQTQLIQSEKMASLGELTAGIAHEIQNPLNFVNNFSEVSTELVEELAEEQRKPNRDTGLEADLLADLKQNLEKINHHGSRASNIVRGMLQHSRTNSGQREPTDLNALCDEYLRLAYHGLRAKDKSFNATLRTDLDASLGLVKVVPQEMGRVLLNLLTNAFYAVQQRQRIDGADYQPAVTIQTRGTDGQACITIGDNGTGMPEDVQRKIFQPFFTTKPTGEGTGLGLSLAYDIVTKGHDGKISVNSEEGQGSRFVVQLPSDSLGQT